VKFPYRIGTDFFFYNLYLFPTAQAIIAIAERRKDMKIKYKFCDGTVQEVEVSAELYAAIQEIEQSERRLCWRDAKHVLSVGNFEYFLEINDIYVEDAAGNSPLDILLRREDVAQVRKAMTALTDKQRELIQKVFFEGMSLRQIAKQTGIAHQTLSESLAAIIKKLKNFFCKHPCHNPRFFLIS